MPEVNYDLTGVFSQGFTGGVENRYRRDTLAEQTRQFSLKQRLDEERLKAEIRQQRIANELQRRQIASTEGYYKGLIEQQRLNREEDIRQYNAGLVTVPGSVNEVPPAQGMGPPNITVTPTQRLPATSVNAMTEMEKARLEREDYERRLRERVPLTIMGQQVMATPEKAIDYGISLNYRERGAATGYTAGEKDIRARSEFIGTMGEAELDDYEQTLTEYITRGEPHKTYPEEEDMRIPLDPETEVDYRRLLDAVRNRREALRAEAVADSIAAAQRATLEEGGEGKMPPPVTLDRLRGVGDVGAEYAKGDALREALNRLRMQQAADSLRGMAPSATDTYRVPRPSF